MIENVLPSTPTGRKSYKSLKHLIKMQVKEGLLTAHERLPGMRTLCDTYEISLATVQRALAELCDESILYSQKGRGTFVAPVHKETKHIGMLCGMGIPGLSDGMFGPLMKSIQTQALEDDKHITLFQAKRKSSGQYNFFDLQDIIRHEVDVLMLVNVVNLGLISSLKQLGIPIIATDLDATDIGVHSVYFDNEASGFDMTKRLIEDGHKDVWFIGGLDQTNSRFDLCRRQRYTGWRLGCRSMGVKPSQNLYMRSYGAEQTLRECVETALENNPPPTAVVAEDGITISKVFESLNIPVDIATWSSETTAEDMMPCARYLAPCQFSAIGVESYALLRQIDEGMHKGMVRRVVESEILTNPAKASIL